MLFFYLSKTLGWFAVATNLIAAVGAVGLLLALTRFRSIGRRVAAASLVFFIAIAISPIGKILAWPLETRFPPLVGKLGSAPDGVIVLGGSIDAEQSRAYGMTDVSNATGRIIAVADLARRFPKARIVFTSGNSSLISNAGSEAAYAKPVLESFGIASQRIELEENSRNTWENATFTKAMLRPQPGQRWLLVTSADHMPRAVGCFRRVGFDVIPYPVDWHTRGWPDVIMPYWKASKNIAVLDSAVHEWVGLVAYWISGKTSELFPVSRQWLARPDEFAHRRP